MNETYLQRFLSDSARNAKRSEIRDLLRLIAKPEIISLAGGLPSPETFPIDELAELMPIVMREHGTAALQYGITEGDAGLRDEIRKLLKADGVARRSIDEILVTTSSQQGLDLVARVFLASGDSAVVGLPSYLGALSAFAATGATLIGVPLDDEGMRTDILEERLIAARRQGQRTKLVYVVPDFQNPAGVTLSLARRLELLEIASEFDLLVVEDSPYRHLRYAGTTLPTVQELDREGRVVSLFTFSKMLFPGLRLGYMVGQPEIITRFVVAKQAMDLCTSGLVQVVAREYLRTGRLPQQVARSRELYGERRAAMLEALETHMVPAWGVKWTKPEGGLFLWVALPSWMDATELLQIALQENVAFVSGRAFHCDGSGRNTMRLNFSFPTPGQIETAIERLARAIRRLVDAHPESTRGGKNGAPVGIDRGHAIDNLSLSLALTEVVE